MSILAFILDNVLIGILSALGVVLIVLSVVLFLKTRRFVDRCQECEGRVVRFDDDVEGDPTFPVVVYEVGGGTFEIKLGSSSELEIGTPMRVTYHPEDPSNAWAAGTLTPWVIPSVITLAGIALIVTAVVMAIV